MSIQSACYQDGLIGPKYRLCNLNLTRVAPELDFAYSSVAEDARRLALRVENVIGSPPPFGQLLVRCLRECLADVGTPFKAYQLQAASNEAKNSAIRPTLFIPPFLVISGQCLKCPGSLTITKERCPSCPVTLATSPTFRKPNPTLDDLPMEITQAWPLRNSNILPLPAQFQLNLLSVPD